MIQSRTEEEVLRLLEHFLIHSGSLGADERHLEGLKKANKENPKLFSQMMTKQYYRRLVRDSLGDKTPPWEGITWVIDLLPHFPNQAIDALNAYSLAHAQEIPDGRFSGLQDAIALIRAKYIGIPETEPKIIKFLQNINPRDFEYLVERLYYKMEYETELTPPQKDGGRDIIAKKLKPAKRETLLVECKRYKGSIGIRIARQLLGVVSSEKANKGVLITPGNLTRDAIKFSKQNPRIELIGGEELVSLLNEYLSPKWTLNIDQLILTSQRKFIKE